MHPEQGMNAAVSDVSTVNTAVLYMDAYVQQQRGVVPAP
jgi:hypothetical protein